MNIATEAAGLVLGDRNDSYGGPAEDFERVSLVWSGLLAGKLKAPITKEETVLMMVGLKLCREVHKPKHDTRVDIVGYTLCLDWITTGKRPQTDCCKTATPEVSEGETRQVGCPSLSANPAPINWVAFGDEADTPVPGATGG